MCGILAGLRVEAQFAKLKEKTNEGINHLNDGGKWMD